MRARFLAFAKQLDDLLVWSQRFAGRFRFKFADALISNNREFKGRALFAHYYCGQHAGSEDERCRCIFAFSGNTDSLDVLIKNRHQALDLVDPIKEDSAIW